MNRIDYLKYLDFPTSSETLSFMQDMVLQVAKLSSIGGSTYILSGCAEVGDKVLPGMLVIDGEVLPYEGGLTSSKISVQEDKESVQVYDDVYQDVYFKRKAVASSTAGARLWSSFSRLPDLTAMAQTLSNHINKHTVAWSSVSDKPLAFNPAPHPHSDLQAQLNKLQAWVVEYCRQPVLYAIWGSDTKLGAQGKLAIKYSKIKNTSGEFIADHWVTLEYSSGYPYIMVSFADGIKMEKAMKRAVVITGALEERREYGSYVWDGHTFNTLSIYFRASWPAGGMIPPTVLVYEPQVAAFVP